MKSGKAKCDQCTLINNDCVLPKINNSKIVFLAEAPGYTEVDTGEYLTGKAGQIFNEILKELNIKREDINILNSVICHPTLGNKNRTPTFSEVMCCNERLFEELKLINPTKIIALGKVAYVALGGNKDAKMFDLVGRVFNINNYEFMVTYHPSSAQYEDDKEGRKKQIKEHIEKYLNTSSKQEPRQLSFW